MQREVRLAAALDEMAELLRSRYGKIESDHPDAVFDAFAEDQRPRDMAR